MQNQTTIEKPLASETPAAILWRNFDTSFDEIDISYSSFDIWDDVDVFDDSTSEWDSTWSNSEEMSSRHALILLLEFFGFLAAACLVMIIIFSFATSFDSTEEDFFNSNASARNELMDNIK